MKRLEKQLKALQDHLTNLNARADKARGQTRRRLKRLERRTRVKVERAVRALDRRVGSYLSALPHRFREDRRTITVPTRGFVCNSTCRRLGS
jgi:hypothetical protein